MTNQRINIKTRTLTLNMMNSREKEVLRTCIHTNTVTQLRLLHATYIKSTLYFRQDTYCIYMYWTWLKHMKQWTHYMWEQCWLELCFLFLVSQRLCKQSKNETQSISEYKIPAVRVHALFIFVCFGSLLLSGDFSHFFCKSINLAEKTWNKKHTYFVWI